ncbi:MAG: helix-turn-helix transcriptional regulator [Dehalococcoidia bacterium]|nr:helix-turn-helix transcriptional regulator [Dehalococcoidia bacterium]
MNSENLLSRETEIHVIVRDSVYVPRGRPRLTPAEGKIFALLPAMSNKQIAAHLGISEQTVKNHVGAILERLGAGDRTQAVAIGLATGMLTLSVKYTPQEEG